jgi:glucose/arabinose dehydrogenase/mono/diheme cytochrome c family protein
MKTMLGGLPLFLLCLVFLFMSRPALFSQASVASFSGAAATSAKPQGNVAFANVQDIFNRNCVRCHQGAGAPAELVLIAGESYANLVNVPSTEYPAWRRVQPGDRATSWLYEKISNPNPPVGSKMGTLSAAEIDLIGLWIDQGATETPVPPYADLEFRTKTLSNGEIDIAYSFSLVVWGGLPPYQFSLTEGELPPGLELDPASGSLFGVPTTAGSYSFAIRVSDSQSPAATLDQTFNMTVFPPGNPWQLPSGFVVENVVSDLHLPVNLAFVPNPGPNPADPYFYVSLLYGDIVMVQRNFEKKIFATGLLTFEATGEFPGSGEMGVTGIAVDPISGDVFAAMVYDNGGYGALRNKVVRFHSSDGGHTADSLTTILADIPAGVSHQIQALTIGPDGKLYVNIGDGLSPAAAPDLNDLRGKTLRMNLDGSMPEDNPFPGTYIYAKGFRNHFGAAWRSADGKLYISDNGQEKDDRLVKVEPGEDYGWNLEAPDLTKGALFLWNPSVSPVAMDFFEADFFPPEYDGQLFVGLAGPAYWHGATDRGKKIQRFELDEKGNVVNHSIFLDYIGNGKATVIGVAFGSDGLYFTDLYGENGFDESGKTHGNIYRIRWIGDDTAAPEISHVQVAAVNATSATITWETDEPATSQVEYGLTTDYGNLTPRSTVAVTNHAVTLSRLASGAVYHFRVRSFDLAGNQAVSGDYIFVTLQRSAQFDTTLEAEAMSVKTTGGERGEGWALFEDGYIADNVNFPAAGSYQFTLRAYGNLAAGEWSMAELRLDQVPLDTIIINSAQYAEFSAFIPVSAGTHEVAIAFINDLATPLEDRNLYLDWLRIRLLTIATDVTSKPPAVLPSTFALQNHPNPFGLSPFNAATRIGFDLPQPAEFQLTVFDVAGREVRQLAAGSRPAGRHEVMWDGRRGDGKALSAGVYLLRLRYRTEKNQTWAQTVHRVMLVK